MAGENDARIKSIYSLYENLGNKKKNNKIE